MAQTAIPLATVLRWASEIGMTEAVVIGRDTAGRVHAASTHGTVASICGLMDHARADIDKALERRANPSDPNRPGLVRKTNDLMAKSDGI